jgi:hypothetical protein
MSNGSVLAQSGANIGQMLGSGMRGLGGNIEGMLTGVGEGIGRRGMEKEAAQLLAANKDNPAALMEAARKFAMQGHKEIAAMFEKAAEAATQRQAQGAVAGTLQPGVTPEQMIQTAQQLNSLGRIEEAMALAGKARELMQTTQEGQALQRRKEAIAESARKLGMEELAERALETSDEESLRAIQKDLRDYERKEVIKTRGIPGRKALAKNAGLEYEPYMSDLSDDNFAKLLDGAGAQLKTFIAPDGTELMLEVNKQSAKVMDPESGKFVRASELGLRPAPNRQQVENIANFKNEKLAEAGIEHFKKLHDDTVTVVQSLNNIEEVLPLTDEMIAGATAQPELFVRRIRADLSEALGLDPEDVALTNTEQYIALAAPRVAAIIKAFGAGTGLSDADREFANKAAAGEISMTAESLQRILKILKKAGENKLSMYNQTVEAMQNNGMSPAANGFVLPARTQRTVTVEPPTDVPPPAGFVEDATP